jgi:hypothetical protein
MENEIPLVNHLTIQEPCPGAGADIPVKPLVDERPFVPFQVGGTVALADKSMTLSTMHYN